MLHAADCTELIQCPRGAWLQPVACPPAMPHKMNTVSANDTESFHMRSHSSASHSLITESADPLCSRPASASKTLEDVEIGRDGGSDNMLDAEFRLDMRFAGCCSCACWCCSSSVLSCCSCKQQHPNQKRAVCQPYGLEGSSLQCHANVKQLPPPCQQILTGLTWS